jgi:hypothetical protein
LLLQVAKRLAHVSWTAAGSFVSFEKGSQRLLHTVQLRSRLCQMLDVGGRDFLDGDGHLIETRHSILRVPGSREKAGDARREGKGEYPAVVERLHFVQPWIQVVAAASIWFPRCKRQLRTDLGARTNDRTCSR